jgi:hypothetical protein
MSARLELSLTGAAQWICAALRVVAVVVVAAESFAPSSASLIGQPSGVLTPAIRQQQKALDMSQLSNSAVPTSNPGQVDVRGPRFAAWVTTAVLITTLLLASISTTTAAIVLGLQAVVFATGAVRGPREHPLRPDLRDIGRTRLGPVQEREPVAPLRFAQLVGRSSRSSAPRDSPSAHRPSA